MRLTGRKELIDNPRFAARVRHEVEVDAIITEWTRQHTKEEAMALITGGAAGRRGLRDNEALRAIHVRGYHFRSARSGVPSPN